MLPGEYSLASVRIASQQGAAFGTLSAVISGAIVGLLIALAFAQAKLDCMCFGAGLSGFIGLLLGAFCSCAYTVVMQLGEYDSEQTGMYLGLLSGVVSAIFSSYFITKKALQRHQDKLYMLDFINFKQIQDENLKKTQ